MQILADGTCLGTKETRVKSTCNVLSTWTLHAMHNLLGMIATGHEWQSQSALLTKATLLGPNQNMDMHA